MAYPNELCDALAGIKDAIEDAEIGGGSSLPEVTSSDNGQVLTVVSGEWNKASVPTELPAVTGNDNGKILQVYSGTWQKRPAPQGLPNVSDADEGKILIVNSSGYWTHRKNALIVEFEQDELNDEIWNVSNNLTGADLESAFMEGREIILNMSNVTGYLVPEFKYVHITSYVYSDDVYQFASDEYSVKCADLTDTPYLYYD